MPNSLQSQESSGAQLRGIKGGHREREEKKQFSEAAGSCRPGGFPHCQVDRRGNTVETETAWVGFGAFLKI